MNVTKCFAIILLLVLTGCSSSPSGVEGFIHAYDNALLLVLTGCSSSPRATANAENLKKLKPGMRIEELNKIMGTPEMIEIHPSNDREYVFRFQSPSGNSDHFRVFVSRSDSTVLRIADGS